MNEEALNEAYAVFKSGGYAGSIEDFKVLIATNTEALNEAYSVFKSGGYADSVEDFKTLLGVTAPSKKKSTFRACWNASGHYGVYFKTYSGKRCFIGVTIR